MCGPRVSSMSLGSLLRITPDTAPETTDATDRQRSARAKDIASAAVFMSISFAATIWSLLPIARGL